MVRGVHRQIWKIQKCLHLHTFLMTQIRIVHRRWYQNPGSIVLIFTSQKSETAKSNQNDKGSLQKTHWRSDLMQKNFGDLIRADHKVLNEEGESRHNSRYAVVVQDLATQWSQSYPCRTKTSQETQRSSQKFLEPTRKPKVIYTDNSLEFGKSCEDLSWNHCTSTPHRSETNGIAERAVRRIKEGTCAVLLHSGLDEKWWVDSMECYCFLRNVQDLLSDRKTLYERRFSRTISRTHNSIWCHG